MPAATPGLSERLASATGPAEGLSLVLEQALSASGLIEGAAVFLDGSHYRLLGVGLDEDREHAIRQAARHEDTPLGDALRAGDRARVPDPGAQGIELAVIPLGDPQPWGAALVEDDSDKIAAVEAVFREALPGLERLREGHELRRRTGELSSERDLLTTIVNSLPDPVVLTDTDNDIILANERANQLFSTESGDSEGRRRAVQLNNLLFSSFLTQSVISTRQTKPRELNLVDPSDGSDLLFEVLPTPVPRPRAGDGAYLSILRNITDLKRALTELEAQFQRSRIAEERVREEWERLNATLENVGDPILVTDNHSNIILMNREAERLFEAPPRDADTRHRRAVRANDTKFTSLMSDFLLQPEDRRVEQVHLEDPGMDTDLPVEVVSSKIVNSRGEPTAVVSVIHDRTQVVENERLARELQQLNEELEDRVRLATVELEERNRRLEWQSRELEKASRLKSEFLASMSHELRTPINAVLGYTSLMREEIYGELTDKQKSGLDKVNTASQHLLDLINDILDLSKIEAGKMPVYLEEVSVRQVVGELFESVEPLAREKGISLNVDAGDDLSDLFTDRTKLKQILLNLLSNAIKFTSEGGVALEAEEVEDERIRIAVRDTGIGIKDEDLEAIFDDFRQVDQSPTREFGGTGLGLSITRKLVDLLEGEIRVESQYGEGSTFEVEIPRRLQPRSRDEQLQRALTAGRSGTDTAPSSGPGPGD